MYKGDYVNGEKTGKGRLEMRDGSYLEGNFIDGNIQGPGIYYYALA
jgi:hypothetical protein